MEPKRKSKCKICNLKTYESIWKLPIICKKTTIRKDNHVRNNEEFEVIELKDKH